MGPKQLKIFDLGFCFARLAWNDDLIKSNSYELTIVSPRDGLVPPESLMIYDYSGEMLRKFIKELDDILNKNGKK